MSKPQTAAQRQKSRDDRQRKLGRKGRKVWATPDEHEQIAVLLARLREGEE